MSMKKNRKNESIICMRPPIHRGAISNKIIIYYLFFVFGNLFRKKKTSTDLARGAPERTRKLLCGRSREDRTIIHATAATAVRKPPSQIRSLRFWALNLRLPSSGKFDGRLRVFRPLANPVILLQRRHTFQNWSS